MYFHLTDCGPLIELNYVYVCVFWGGGQEKEYKKMSTVQLRACWWYHYTFFSAPSRAPRSVGHTVSNTTTLTLSWRPPAERFHNGVIRGYKVNVTEVLTGTVMHLDTSTTSILVPFLHPYYEYEYTVAAYTVTVGPYSFTNRMQMPEDGECSVCNRYLTYCGHAIASVVRANKIMVKIQFSPCLHKLYMTQG